MSRKQPKRRAGNMVFHAIAGIFICAVVCGVGLGAASADTSDDIARAGALGFDSATQAATSTANLQAASVDPSESPLKEQSALASTSTRTIDSSLKMIEDKEEAERQRIAAEREAERKRIAAEREAERKRIEAENAAALERVRSTKAMQGVASASGEPFEYSLPAVDWTVGREAFVGEWAARIDAYLAGSALEGYGYAFAEAAWDNGVDPRWSPAISDTESGKGSVCFKPCNAWGWGENAWGDWDTAIRAHVAGLANGYGYCITPEAAATYCPPNTAFWYSHTIEQMSYI